MSGSRVRIRGIYATALTERLRDGFDVVQATRSIERRFEDAFPTVEHDVSVTTTEDRLGVGVSGAPEGVEEVRDRLLGGGIDTFAWEGEAPPGAVFEATVVETLGSGAVVDLGPREAFLPYDAATGYVDDGDERRLQVHEPAPPWADRRPVVGEEIRAAGGLATLVRGAGGPVTDVADTQRATELVRMTGILEAPVPDGWGVRWERPASDASIDALEKALARVADRADAMGDHLDGGPPPAAGAWVLFGRESRFALDGDRRRVVPTMAGHHRVKAGGGPASAAVDLAERLGVETDGFPFEAVAETFGPAVGDRLQIEHAKPDGRRFTLGRGEVTDRDGRTVTVRREMTGGGEYDALGVPREAGDVAVTALREGRWWYPTAYRDEDGAVKGTYVNVCTPVEVFPDRAAYVDLHVDVVRDRDGTVRRVDDDELDAAVEAGDVTAELAAKAREVASAVQRALA